MKLQYLLLKLMHLSPHGQKLMKTITIDLIYDPGSNLHHLPFDELVSLTDDFILRLRPIASGVCGSNGMVAINNIISLDDIKRALAMSMFGLPEPEEGIVALLLPGNLHEVGWTQFYPDVPETRSILFSTGATPPVGFPADRLIVTIRYILLPSYILPLLAKCCTDKGINITEIAVLTPKI